MRFIWILALTGVAGAQTFEVASVKLVKGPITHSSDPAVRGRRVVATAVSLPDLITSSYGVRYDQVEGVPAWAKTEHYDIEATAGEGAGPLTRDEMRQMVRALLQDRFRLEVHRETREAPVYLLVVANGGPKFREAAADAVGGWSVNANDKGLRMEANRSTVEQLARQLSGTAGRPVIDKTGLAGTYAFTLVWFPADRERPPELDAPSMFDAVREQLGLRLEAGKAPLEKLIVDRAEKPTEN